VDDSSIYLLVLIIVGIILVTPIVALVRAGRASKHATALEAELQAGLKVLRELTGRIYALEQGHKSQTGEPAESPIAAPTEVSTAPPIEIPTASPKPAPEPIDPIAAIISPPTPARESEPAIPKTPASQTLQATSAWPNQPPQPIRPPSFSAQQKSEAAQPKRNWADVEEKLGANWLNKIGTAAFVIGVALLLNYSMHYLGAEGKIILGYAISAILLIVGIIGERKERYRVAGRAVLGGGWALAYFTTYALHNIAAVRLVQSAPLGFTLLFIVAVAMVLHSLRYHSEITTGFAYLLAFVTIAVSEIPMGALVASALLAASLAYVLRVRKWFAIEPLAIIATYAVHWMWLNQIYERAYKAFPQFNASVALLTAYWTIYLVSYFLREAPEDPQRQLLTASFLLNAAGYLAVLHHESFHPELRFWFLTAAGIVYLAVSGFSKATNRRLAFILASTLGMTLVIAAVPYRYSGNNLEILWLVEAEAVLIVGWRTVDAHLRKLGWAASTVLAGYVFFHNLVPRFYNWHPPDTHVGWLLVALAVAYYANGQLRRASKILAADLDDATDDVAIKVSPVIATMFALSAAWIALPFMWTALVWTIIAVALVTVGRRFIDRTLITCGHLAAIFAFVRLVGINLQRGDAAAGSIHGITARLITVAISSILFYAISRRCAYPSETNHDPATPGAFATDALARFGGITALYSAAATILVTDLIWRELTSAAIALAWGIFAMILLEAARSLPDRPLLIQSRILLLASFARIFFADLNSIATIGHFSARVLTVSILAALYFYVALTSEQSSRFRAILFWLGTISIVSLIRFQLPAEWVAVAWAALVVVLYFAGSTRKLSTFRDQSFGLAFLVGIRCAFDNFYQIARWHFTNTRIATVVAASALLYILFVVTQITKQSRKDSSLNDSSVSPRKENRFFSALRRFWTLVRIYPQHLFFFIPTILLTVLLSLEVRRGFLTATWGIEALIIFLIVLKMDERAYRWFSLLLFLLCVGRIIVHDVWNLDALGRIISFMGLGLTLLAVSFLYARHRELLRKVL